MFGLSVSELGFVSLLVVLVLLAPQAPKLGERLGGLFEKRPDRPVPPDQPGQR